MSIIITTITLIIWLLIIPFALGLLVAKKIENKEQCMGTVLIAGTLVYVALFQVVYVMLLLCYNNFTVLTWVVGTLIVLVSGYCLIRERAYAIEIVNKSVHINRDQWKSLIPWLFVVVVVGYQLYNTICYQFIDGDDAYYLPISVLTQWSDVMYEHNQYTGYTSLIDIRHAFSGAPIFVGFLARVCMVHPAIMYHTILPPIILLLMYLVYGKIGQELFQDQPERVPVFVGVISMLYLFGNTSIYTQATFALTRTSQGKSIISNLAIPITCYLMMRTYRKIREVRSFAGEVALLAMVVLMGGFSTMLGLVLIPIITILGFLILAVIEHRWKLLLWQIPILLPAYVLGVAYLLVV